MIEGNVYVQELSLSFHKLKQGVILGVTTPCQQRVSAMDHCK